MYYIKFREKVFSVTWGNECLLIFKQDQTSYKTKAGPGSHGPAAKLEELPSAQWFQTVFPVNYLLHGTV